MTLSSKERAALRAEAHHLTPLVHVGHQGFTDALVQTLDDTLRTHELVKVSLAKTTDVKPKELPNVNNAKLPKGKPPKTRKTKPIERPKKPKT